MQYEVIVSNVGTIYSGDKEYEAQHCINDAVYRTRQNTGRMSGESVTLIGDGYIICESDGPLYITDAQTT